MNLQILSWNVRDLHERDKRLQIIRSNFEWDTVLVEDVDSDCSLENAGDLVDVY